MKNCRQRIDVWYILLVLNYENNFLAKMFLFEIWNILKTEHSEVC